MTKKNTKVGTALVVNTGPELGVAARAAEARLHRLVGVIDNSLFMERVSGISVVRAYLTAKAVISESGSIALTLEDGSQRNVSTVEEFCDIAMPYSARRCRELVRDMEALGEDLFQRAERLGFRARDYRALHALPGDDQAKVKAALQSADIEEVRDVLQGLAQSNAALLREKAEAEKKLAAKDRVIEAKSKRIDQLHEQEEARLSASLPEREAAQIADLTETGLEAESSLLRAIKAVSDVFTAPASEAARLKAEQNIHYLAQRFEHCCLAAGITIDLAERVGPIWTVSDPKPAEGRSDSGR